MDVTGKTKIFRKDFDGRPAYSRAISSQKFENGQKGAWVRAYESVQFPKGTQLEDGCTVDIKKAFEAVYDTSNGVKRKLVVQEYEVVSEIAAKEPEFTALTNDDIPF